MRGTECCCSCLGSSVWESTEGGTARAGVPMYNSLLCLENVEEVNGHRLHVCKLHCEDCHALTCLRNIRCVCLLPATQCVLMP